MTEYQNGDLIEAVKGDTTIRGRVQSTNNDFNWLTIHGITATISHNGEHGWAVTVIEKVLPTEAGIYADRDKDVWHLGTDGLWTLLSAMGNVKTDRSELDLFKPETCHPFTRLEPANITAKKVIDEVRGIFGGPGALLDKDVDKIAARFGVSS